jgi:rhodanese-related sulfurtransferase
MLTMTKLNEILNVATTRAAAKALPYVGELTPQEAFEVLQQQAYILVDVRSKAELDLVGRIPGAMHIEWAFYPGMVANPEFASQLQAQIDKNQAIVFMCRTGGRSHNAAVVASGLGYKAYNMLEGFEGEANAEKQRTLINGWKHAGLPWSN